MVSAIERQAPVVAHAVLGEPAGRHGAVYVEPTSRGDVLVHAFSSDSASVPQLRMIFGERAHGPGLKRFALSAPEGRLSHSSYPVARAASRRGALQEALVQLAKHAFDLDPALRVVDHDVRSVDASGHTYSSKPLRRVGRDGRFSVVGKLAGRDGYAGALNIIGKLEQGAEADPADPNARFGFSLAAAHLY